MIGVATAGGGSLRCPASRHQQEDLGVQKILIVDDENNIRHILDFSLGAEGFTVLTATNGDEAFAVAVAELPSLIILDVMMPGSCDGVETCRRLKAESRTAPIPVILLTARTEREERARGRAAGADAYITKPFSPQRVVDTVQTLLGVPRR
jgi:DNA-binding response OmpR family regulator